MIEEHTVNTIVVLAVDVDVIDAVTVGVLNIRHVQPAEIKELGKTRSCAESEHEAARFATARFEGA